MKKFLLLSLAMLAFTSSAFANGDDWRFMRRDPTNIVNLLFDVSTPSVSSFMVLDINSGVATPKFVSIGGRMSYASGIIDVADLPTSAITGLDAALLSKYDIPTGTTGQYLRGDGSVAAFPTTFDSFGDGTTNKAYTATEKTKLGAISGTNTGDQDLSGLVTKTTTVNGHALSANVTVTKSDVSLGNVDNTADSAKSFSASQITSGTKTNSFISDFATAARALFSVSGNGSYNSTTGVITVNTPSRTFNSPSRALNTAFQISTTQDATVSYAVDVSVTSALLAGQQGTVILEYADNAGMSTNVVSLTGGTSATGGVLNVQNIGTVFLGGTIPAGKYVRIRTVNTTSTPSFTIRTQQQEVLL